MALTDTAIRKIKPVSVCLHIDVFGSNGAITQACQVMPLVGIATVSFI